MKGSTLVIPCIGMGMASSIAADLAILNDGMTRIGFFKSEYISPVIINDSLTLAGAQPGQIQMPAEFWLNADGSKTFLVIRSGITEGNMRRFCEQFVAFCKEVGFINVALVTSTGSPVGRERQSNRQLPEIFAYANNFIFKNSGAKFY